VITTIATAGAKIRNALGIAWANRSLVAALLLGALSSYVIAVSGNIKEANLRRELADKDRAFEQYKADKDREFEQYKLYAGKQISEANARALEASAALKNYQPPRTLQPDSLRKIAGRLRSFNGQRVSIGAIPPIFEHVVLGEQIGQALSLGGINSDWNQSAAEIQVGPVRGVVARYITGNERGENFAKALADALLGEGISAVAEGGMMDKVIKPDNRNDEGNSWVVIAVGEKPQQTLP
jgi:hypothetical protein